MNQENSSIGVAEKLINVIPTVVPNPRINSMNSQRQDMKQHTVDGSYHQKNIIDLDEIVEKWAWKMWEMSKRSREDSKYRRDELDIKINWKRVQFWQSEASFNHPNHARLPKSQTLFKTHFTNNTDRDQEYSLRAERSTMTTLNFSYNRAFTKGKEGQLIFKLPKEILEIGGGIRHEQRVEYGKDSTFETRMTWSADSIIRVAPHSKANAELCITEDEYYADFSVEARFSGRVSIMISTRNQNAGYYKYIEGDIANIIADILRTGSYDGMSPGQFEIHEATQTVRTTINGRCNFRFGIEQYVNVEQEKLPDVLSSINNEPPPKYRPVFSTSNNR